MISHNDLKIKIPSLITFLGVTRTGKTTKLVSVLRHLNEYFDRVPTNIIFFHKFDEPSFVDLGRRLPIRFIRWPPAEHRHCLIDEVKKQLVQSDDAVNLLIFDDLQVGWTWPKSRGKSGGTCPRGIQKCAHLCMYIAVCFSPSHPPSSERPGKRKQQSKHRTRHHCLKSLQRCGSFHNPLLVRSQLLDQTAVSRVGLHSTGEKCATGAADANSVAPAVRQSATFARHPTLLAPF